MNARTALQGAGAAALILFPFYRGMLSSPGYVRMHTPGSVIGLTFSLIANLVLASVALMLAAAWLHRKSGARWSKLVLPALIGAAIAEMAYIAGKGWESTSLFVIVLVAILFLSAVLRWRWPRGEQVLLQVSGAALIGLGFFCIFIVLQLLHLALWHQSPNTIGKAAPPVVNRGSQPKIVWILFDSLSYRQTFGNRYPNLQLPNFDELRKSSTLFTDTQPVTTDTQTAIPSILLGETIARVNYTNGNRLQVGRASGAMYPFDAAQTPFAAASQRGLTTGVVGWYNPYCNILTPYLNQCYWTDELLKSGRQARIAFWRELSYPWNVYGMILAHPLKVLSRDYRVSVLQHILSPVYMEEILDARYRIDTYRKLMQHTDGMLGPSGPDFIFIHLPLPHPPGFYNRETGQLDASGRRSYIDNLSLADRTLGHVLTVLEQSPRWNNTSILICGDHSWRTFLWKGTAYWTPDGEAASHGGVFDPRPMLMVHLAGQTTPATVSQPFPLLDVHDILDDLVTGKQPAFHSLSTPSQ